MQNTKDFLGKAISLVRNRISHLEGLKKEAKEITKDEIGFLVLEGNSIIKKFESLKRNQGNITFLGLKDENELEYALSEAVNFCKVQDQIFSSFSNWTIKCRTFMRATATV